MIYSLYIAENCHECEEVVKAVSELKAPVDFLNVDSGNHQPPIPTFAYPALFKKKILIAYGSDIVEYLRKRPGNY